MTVSLILSFTLGIKLRWNSSLCCEEAKHEILSTETLRTSSRGDLAAALQRADALQRDWTAAQQHVELLAVDRDSIAARLQACTP